MLDPKGVSVELEHQTDVLSSALVDQMLTHYLQLLNNALAEPERRLTKLDLLGAGEREAVLAQSHGKLSPRRPPRWSRCLKQPRPSLPTRSR